MSIIFTWLMALTCQAPESKTFLSIDEVNARAVGYSAQNRHLVLLTSFLEPRLTLVDMQKEQAFPIQDGRFRQFSAHPIPFGSGFAVVARLIKCVYFIDADGAFSGQWPLSDVSGWQPDFKIVGSSPFGTHKMLLTLSLSEEEALAAAILDLDLKKVDILYSEAHDPLLTSAWAAAGDFVYRYVSETGEIRQGDIRNFTKWQIIRQGRDPVKRNHKPGRAPFHGRLEPPHVVNDMLFFPYKEPLDTFGNVLEEPRLMGLMVDAQAAYAVPYPVFGSFEGKWLYWDWENVRFLIETNPPQRTTLTK